MTSTIATHRWRRWGMGVDVRRLWDAVMGHQSSPRMDPLA